MRRIVIFSLALWLVFVVAMPAAAQQFPPLSFTFRWEPSISPNASGYLLCLDVASIPDAPDIDGCPVMAQRMIIDGGASDIAVISYTPPTHRGTFYVRAKTFDDQGFESPWSNEVAVPFVATALPPPGTAGPAPPSNLRME